MPPKGEKKPPKEKKDKGPKKPMSAYLCFSQEERPRIKEENPDASFGDMGKLIGARWKELSEEAKAPFVEMAAAEKTRYEQECKDAGIDPAANKKKSSKKAAKKASKKKAASSDEGGAQDDDEEDDD